MNREDYDILSELDDTVTQLEQGAGDEPGRGVSTSSVTKRQITEFARKCERGELKGRARRRKANQLFLQTLRLLGDV